MNVLRLVVISFIWKFGFISGDLADILIRSFHVIGRYERISMWLPT